MGGSDEVALGERLATIETKLDVLIVKREDHEARLRKLERWAWVMAGAAGAIGGSIARIFPAAGG